MKTSKPNRNYRVSTARRINRPKKSEQIAKCVEEQKIQQNSTTKNKQPKISHPIAPIMSLLKSDPHPDFMISNPISFKPSNPPIEFETVHANKVVNVFSKRNLETSKLIEKTINFEQSKTSDIPQLFMSKCKVCLGFCNYKDDHFDVKIKQIKHETLIQLYEGINNSTITRSLPLTCMNSLFQMTCINIFRSCPKLKNFTEFQLDIAFEDKEWPHLEYIYLIFQHVLRSKVLNISSNQLKSYINQLFKIIYSPDLREQKAICECLNCFIHSYRESQTLILSKIKTLIISSQNNQTNFLCLPSLLSFYSKNISYFRMLDDAFIQQYLLPLMGSYLFPYFSVQYIELFHSLLKTKPTLSNDYTTYILKHWPVTNHKKLVIYVSMLQNIIKEFPQYLLPDTINSLFKLLIDCVSNPTSEISQQALYLLNDDHVVAFFCNLSMNLKNCLIFTLQEVGNTHWIQSTRFYALETLGAYKTMLTTEDITRTNILLLTSLVNDSTIEEKRLKNWKLIEQMSKKPSFKHRAKSLCINENNSGNLIPPSHVVKPPAYPQNRRPKRLYRRSICPQRLKQ